MHVSKSMENVNLDHKIKIFIHVEYFTYPATDQENIELGTFIFWGDEGGL